MRRRVLCQLFLIALLVACASVAGAAVTATTGTLTTVAPTGDASTLAGNGGNYSLGSGWSGLVTLQRSFNAWTTWEAVATFTAPQVGVINDTEPAVQYRFVAKADGTFVGSCPYRISSW